MKCVLKANIGSETYLISNNPISLIPTLLQNNPMFELLLLSSSSLPSMNTISATLSTSLVSVLSYYYFFSIVIILYDARNCHINILMYWLD